MRDEVITNARSKIMSQGMETNAVRRPQRKVTCADVVGLGTHEATPLSRHREIAAPRGASQRCRQGDRRVCRGRSTVTADDGHPMGDVYQKIIGRVQQPENRTQMPRPPITGLA
jgi:hypothetical protein